MNIPHDSSCHEGSKNVSFIQVRNLKGQNHPGHTVMSVEVLFYIPICAREMSYISIKKLQSVLLIVENVKGMATNRHSRSSRNNFILLHTGQISRLLSRSSGHTTHDRLSHTLPKRYVGHMY